MMSMSESGRAVRELLAALVGRGDVTVGFLAARERARETLRRRAWANGDDAVAVVDELVEAGRAATAAVAELERQLAEARGLQHLPAVIDPPAGHQWLTSYPMPIAPRPDLDGRLYCSTCTIADEPDTTSPRIVLAAECLERSR